ncbi:MAG: DNA-binding response regulator [Sedimenticola sp.]|nr:MAG: DNA-binding response regulator [Sedimenticola sp.]
MKILIADDEAPARERLRTLIGEIGDPYQVIAEAATGREAVDACQVHNADLVLLDIRMPEMDGLDAAAQLTLAANPPAVVFVTAFEEHALDAFERNAIDYLLKPIRRERLQKALDKASLLTRPQVQALTSLRQGQQEVISASYRGGLIRIPLEEVIYLQADQKYVVARHIGGEVLLEESLKSLEERFSLRFLRIHRNALVDRQRLRGLVKLADGRCMATLEDTEQQLEVSRRHLPEVRRWLKGR